MRLPLLGVGRDCCMHAPGWLATVAVPAAHRLTAVPQRVLLLLVSWACCPAAQPYSMQHLYCTYPPQNEQQRSTAKP